MKEKNNLIAGKVQKIKKIITRTCNLEKVAHLNLAAGMLTFFLCILMPLHWTRVG